MVPCSVAEEYGGGVSVCGGTDELGAASPIVGFIPTACWYIAILVLGICTILFSPVTWMTCPTLTKLMLVTVDWA